MSTSRTNQEKLYDKPTKNIEVQLGKFDELKAWQDELNGGKTA